MKVTHTHVDYKSLFPHQQINDKVLMAAAKRVNTEGVKAAKQRYLDKRQSSGPSAIISSFEDSILSSNKTTVIGVIQVGGVKAPYAVWVDQGHKLRNGNWWEGYHFMDAAADKIEEVAYIIMDDEIRKALK